MLAIDCIMKMPTVNTKTILQSAPFKQLDDLVFADDLALLFHTRQQMQDNNLAFTTVSVGLNKGKTKIWKVNCVSSEPLSL